MPGGDTTVTCPSCGAANAADSAFCENCGSKLPVEETGGPAAPVPVGAPFLGGQGRAVAAAAAVVGFAAVLAAVVVVVRRGDDGDDEPFVVDTFLAPTEEAETQVDETETIDESFPATDADFELYDHIPGDIDDNCESDASMPENALAGAVCEVAEEDILVQYWLFDEGETMDQEYAALVAAGTHVTDGSCPDDPPDASTWVDEDDVTRGSLACYVSTLDEGDDAHVVWTHGDLLILGIVSHVGIDAEAEPLMDFWMTSAGPV